MFNDGLIDVESSGIELEEVPENCDQAAKDVLADAERLVADLERYETLCKWLEAEVTRACDEQKTQIMETLSSNESRLDDS